MLFSESDNASSRSADLSAAVDRYRILLGRAVKRTPLWMYALCLLPPALVLAATAVQPYVPPASLLRDWPFVVYEVDTPSHLPMYYGFVSNLGVMAWISAAAVCTFAGWLLASPSKRWTESLFLLYPGVLTAVLAVDDFFMVHEEVFPYVTGLAEPYLLSAYAIAFAAYVIAFREMILQQHCALLLLASCFFASSAAVDLFLEDLLWGSDLLWFLEDGMKAFGIWTWVVFWCRTAWDLVAAELRPRA